MKAILLSLIAAFVVGGCSHTVVLTPQSEPYDYNRANAHLGHWSGIATLQDEDQYHGQDFRIRPDSVAWHSPKTEMVEIMQRMGITAQEVPWTAQPISQMSEIRVKDKGRGSVQGVVAGLIGGAAIFALISSNEDDGTLLKSGHDFEVFLPVMIGSTVVGSLIGSNAGVKTIVRFEWPVTGQ